MSLVRFPGSCSESGTKTPTRKPCIGSRCKVLPFLPMDTGRTPGKILQSIREYLEWRQHHWWEIGGRWHPETVAYSQALNLLNECAARPEPRSGVA